MRQENAGSKIDESVYDFAKGFYIPTSVKLNMGYKQPLYVAFTLLEEQCNFIKFTNSLNDIIKESKNHPHQLFSFELSNNRYSKSIIFSTIEQICRDKQDIGYHNSKAKKYFNLANGLMLDYMHNKNKFTYVQTSCIPTDAKTISYTDFMKYLGYEIVGLYAVLMMFNFNDRYIKYRKQYKTLQRIVYSYMKFSVTHV